VLQFSIADKDKKDYTINAIALDPDTTLGGMATDVDERYFTRVLLPAAAGFMQGFGEALSQGSSNIVQNGTTTIVQQSGKGLQQGMFQGAASAGQALGQFFQNQANNTKPLVRVAAGTPMGLFFITSVTDQVLDPSKEKETLNPTNALGYGQGQGYGQNAEMSKLSAYQQLLLNRQNGGAGGDVPYPTQTYGQTSPYGATTSPYGATSAYPGYSTTGYPGTSSYGVGNTYITH
jgi:hypothetical protein